MIYFFDFDGTIVDIWKRFYHVFLDAGKVSGIEFDSYKTHKLLLKRDNDVAWHFGVSLDAHYFENKKIMLEQTEYLKFDTLLVDSELLIRFFDNKEAYILSKRRNKSNLLEELKRLKIESLISRVIVIDPDSKISKLDYLRQNVTVPFTLIGDSTEESSVSVLDIANVLLVNTGLDTFDVDETHKNCRVIEGLNNYLRGELNGAV